LSSFWNYGSLSSVWVPPFSVDVTLSSTPGIFARNQFSILPPSQTTFLFLFEFFFFSYTIGQPLPVVNNKKKKKKLLYLTWNRASGNVSIFLLLLPGRKKKEMYLIRFFYWVSYSFLFNMIPEKKGNVFPYIFINIIFCH
jgi:hypothetical protein